MLVYVGLFSSTGDEDVDGDDHTLRPVVTLAPNVVFTGQDANNAWNLGISE